MISVHAHVEWSFLPRDFSASLLFLDPPSLSGTGAGPRYAHPLRRRDFSASASLTTMLKVESPPRSITPPVADSVQSRIPPLLGVMM